MKYALSIIAAVLVWYFFGTLLTVFNIFLIQKDRHVLLMTAVHSLMQWLCSWGLKGLFPPTPKSEIRQLSFWHLLVGFFSSMEIVTANVSLAYVTLALYTMVKSTTPAAVLIFASAFGYERITMRLLYAILAICGGAAFSVVGDVHGQWKGLALVGIATLFSGARWASVQKLLDKKEPIYILGQIAPYSACILFVSSLVVETTLVSFATLTRMALGGILSFGMIAAEFFVVSRTSPLSLSILGIVKEIWMIFVGVIVFEEQVSRLAAVGVVVSIGGILAFYAIRREDLQVFPKNKLSNIFSDVEIL